MKESPLTPDIHTVLQDYAQGPHYTNDLSIKTANSVERALVILGCGTTVNYPAGLLTRQFSRNKISDFPDQRIHALRNPSSMKRNIIPWVSAQGEESHREQEGFFGVRKMSAAIRTILRDDIAESVGASPDEICNGYIRRLLDKPEVCDLLIQYFNEYRGEQFLKKLKESEFFRAGGQLRTYTKNKAKYEKPSTLGSYIARTFCPDEAPSIENRGKTSPTIREVVLNERESLLRQLPIDPDKISDESLIKVGLTPPDFSKYTLQARRRYKMAVVEQFLGLLSRAQMIERKHGHKKSHQKNATTARVIKFIGADGIEKIGIFSTKTGVMTQTVSSGEKTKNRNHTISDTELHIFAGRAEAIRSQDHAIESMQPKIALYAGLLNALGDYSKQKKPEEKEAYLTTLVNEFAEKFSQSQSYHGKLIHRYLLGSDEGNGTPGVIQTPSLIGNLRSTLKRAIGDKKAKIAEIQLIKKDI